MEMSQREIKDFARKLYFAGYTTDNTDQIKSDYDINQCDFENIMEVLEMFERNDTDMSAVNIEDMACALYDGEWRKEDRDELKAEYNLTDTEADRVRDYLEKLEIENSEGED